MRIAWTAAAALVGLSAAIACGTKTATTARSPSAISADAPVAAGASMPGPAPRPAPIDALALNAGCLACHQEAAAEWSGSMHRRAYTDPVFQQALAIEPLPFCRGCHAPEAAPERPAPAPLADLGVACVSCHLVDGVVLAAPRPGRAADPHRGRDAPPVLRDPAFGTAAACAGCHEFLFPDGRAEGRVELMQSTVTEAKQSPFAEVACAACHMPETRGGRRRHGFASTRDPEALRRALDVAATRHAEGVTIVLEPQGVGHAFPTGDLFRRLKVHAELVGPDMNVIAEARRYLARHFESRPHAGALGRTQIRDDRPGGTGQGQGPVVVDLSFGEAEAHRGVIHWEVVYERVAHPAPGGDGGAEVAAAIVLARGRLPIAP